MRHCFVPALALMLACTACKNPPSSAASGGGTSAAEATAPAAGYDRPGYVTAVVNDRLWVFRRGSKEHADFLKNGEPTISVVRIGAGPGGMTLKAPDFATLDGWMAAK